MPPVPKDAGFQGFDSGISQPQDSGRPDPQDSGTPIDGGSSDAGGIDAGGTGPFAGAPPYKATLGPSSRNFRHPGGAFNPNPAGQACFNNCHNGTNGRELLIGGTVYRDRQNRLPAPAAEVRLVLNGVATSAYSDGDGNFFVAGKAYAGGGSVGVRHETATKVMSASPLHGNCNGCHNGNPVPLIQIP